MGATTRTSSSTSRSTTASRKPVAGRVPLVDRDEFPRLPALTSRRPDGRSRAMRTRRGDLAYRIA